MNDPRAEGRTPNHRTSDPLATSTISFRFECCDARPELPNVRDEVRPVELVVREALAPVRQQPRRLSICEELALGLLEASSGPPVSFPSCSWYPAPDSNREHLASEASASAEVAPAGR